MNDTSQQLRRIAVLDSLEHAQDMIAFLNHAYNMPDSDKDLPMGNKEKMGGMLFFNHLEDRLKVLMEEIRNVIK